MEIALLIIFVVGYFLIAIEHVINLNKTATALLTGILCWTIYALNTESHLVEEELMVHLGEISSILFFLMGAMTIVELVDAHDGFEIINKRIATQSIRRLLWIFSLLSFFLSAVLDNLTTTIVMVTLVIKMVRDPKMRLYFIGMIIIAANAGGAWSPIGDITTTMLWIGGQISTTVIIGKLILPSLIAMLVPLLVMTLIVKGKLVDTEINDPINKDIRTSERDQKIIFIAGVLVLVAVPIFKTVTHLPPFMGILFGLGILWMLTEILHRNKAETIKKQLSVSRALEHMDVPSVLFFLGILLAVSVLQNTGQLGRLASYLSNTIESDTIIVTVLGLMSAIVDNVPIVAAAMGMYSLEVYPMDHNFWVLLAFCAGTGGSALIIGSAAGVAAMGLEKVPFGWYLKHITWLAVLGYFAGIGAFLLQEAL